MHHLMQFFHYEHLPEHLKRVSQPCGELAQQMDESLPESSQKDLGLQRLIEAKDCFVRSLLEKKE